MLGGRFCLFRNIFTLFLMRLVAPLTCLSEEAPSLWSQNRPREIEEMLQVPNVW